MRARINGRYAQMLVDTGADGHVLLPAFAAGNGMTTVAFPDAAPLRGVRSVELRLEGGERVTQDIAVYDLPGVGVAENQLAGIVSPQLFATEAMDVVIDLPNHRLRLAKVSARPTGAAMPLSACKPLQAGLPTRNYHLKATINGKTFDLKVDTGRFQTALWKTSLDASDAAWVDHWQSADSIELDADIRLPSGQVLHQSVAVVVTEATPEGEVFSHRKDDGACADDGLLGMDILQQCVLVLGVHDGLALCPGFGEVPAPAPP